MPRLAPATANPLSARSITIASFLLTALLPMVLCACSTTPSPMPMPELQANLRQDCPPLPPAPVPLIGAERDAWENLLISLYGDCASRHHHTVEAWPATPKSKDH